MLAGRALVFLVFRLANGCAGGPPLPIRRIRRSAEWRAHRAARNRSGWAALDHPTRWADCGLRWAAATHPAHSTFGGMAGASGGAESIGMGRARHRARRAVGRRVVQSEPARAGPTAPLRLPGTERSHATRTPAPPHRIVDSTPKTNSTKGLSDPFAETRKLQGEAVIRFPIALDPVCLFD